MRLACVYVPALALQLLLRRVQNSATTPVAVLRGAEILWANRCAQGLGVRRGMRLHAARALACALHAEEVPEREVAQGVQSLWHGLLQFTPSVEPAMQQPGLFWLDPNGLQELYPSLDAWSAQVHGALRAQAFHNTVAVGFNRYFTYAMACTQRGAHVAADAASERAQAARVPLAKLHIESSLRDALSALGIATLGEFLQLPVGELRQRFGEEAERMHRLAHATVWTPLQPHHVEPPLCVEEQIEPADADQGRLLFAIKGMLQKVTPILRGRCEAYVTLYLRLQMSAKLFHHERLQPAAPTLDERALLELLRLRLATVQLAAPVESLHMRVESTRVDPSQLEMLQHKPRRDAHAATLALAKVRAALGDGAVTRARLCAAHIPEARFTWDSVTQVLLPRRSLPAVEQALLPLVRRVLPQVQPLPPRPHHAPEAWLGTSHGIVNAMTGPFRLHSHWWSEPVVRDYYYVHTVRDQLLWVYHHGRQRRWYLHGVVD